MDQESLKFFLILQSPRYLGRYTIGHVAVFRTYANSLILRLARTIQGPCRFAVWFLQEYISSKSVQLLQTAFLHIDVTSASVNPISGGTSCTYVNHSLH